MQSQGAESCSGQTHLGNKVLNIAATQSSFGNQFYKLRKKWAERIKPAKKMGYKMMSGFANTSIPLPKNCGMTVKPEHWLIVNVNGGVADFPIHTLLT